jgi:hypothetical protein
MLTSSISHVNIPAIPGCHALESKPRWPLLPGSSSCYLFAVHYSKAVYSDPVLGRSYEVVPLVGIV